MKCVGAEVEYHLMNLSRITVNHHLLSTMTELQIDIGRQGRFDQVDDFMGNGDQIRWPETFSRWFAESKDLLDDSRAAPGGFNYSLQIFCCLRFRIDIAKGQFGGIED